MTTYMNWLGAALLAGSMLCSACAGGARAASDRLVNADDLKLLDEIKQKKVEREDLLAKPWKYVVTGEGAVSTFDRGFLSTYTEIRGYPLHNRSRFDIVSLEADVTMLQADGSVLATVPVKFKGGLLADENKILECTSPAVQGKARRFTVLVRKVKLHSD